MDLEIIILSGVSQTEKETCHLISLVCGIGASPMAQQVKNPPAMQETQKTWVRSWVGKIPWRRAWQPSPVFLLGESHGLTILAGYSPKGHKESDMIERLIHTHTHTHTHTHIYIYIIYIFI